jgi:2'-5' RNA ligase
MSAPAARVRLFAALELPPEALAALEAFRDRAADPEVWRPLPAESLHVTLAFLGATDPELVEPLGGALRAASGPAPRLRLGGALLLPPRRARVLCVALDDLDEELGALQDRVSAGLAATGAYAPEVRPFRPHVTVGRLRRGVAAPRVVDVVPEPVAFHGSALTLFASRLSPGGARYEALVRMPLAPHLD